MELGEKLKLIQEDVAKQIDVFSLKRGRTKSKAFKLKLSSILSSASITVLLGLNLESDLWLTILKNIALLLGAVITTLHAVESFYDYRALWIQYTITLVRLYDLKRDLDFYIAGEEISNLDAKEITKFLNRLDSILRDDLKNWLKIKGRTESAETEKNKL